MEKKKKKKKKNHLYTSYKKSNFIYITASNNLFILNEHNLYEYFE